MKFKIAEKDILKASLQYLKMRGYVCKRNNSGMSFGNYKGKAWAIKIGEPGWPDIDLITKTTGKICPTCNQQDGGRYAGIEIKTPTGVLSDSQLNIGGQIIKTGGIWFPARSLDEIIEKGF